MNKNILFVITSKTQGGSGAGRVLSLILNNIDGDMYQSTAVIISSNKTHVYGYDIPGNSKIIHVKKKRKIATLYAIFKLIRIIRKIEPALIVTFLTYTNYITIIANKLAGKKTPLIISEHRHMRIGFQNEKYGKIKKIIAKFLYPKADAIITVSRGIKECLVEDFSLDEEKCYIVYNSIDLEQIDRLSKEEIVEPIFKKNIPIIISVGRIVSQKNYPLLLKSFAKIKNLTDAFLVILGEGPKKGSLETLTSKLEISERVIYLGFHRNPYKYMANSTMLVLSSSFEGFPLVLLEAMACGVPIVSTNCHSGPNEIISDGKNGLLVPTDNEDHLAAAIMRLLKNGQLRKEIASRGKAHSKDFQLMKMIKNYENIFLKFIG